GDETELDRVFGDAEDYGDRGCCQLGCQRGSGSTGRGDHGDLPANQVGRQFRQSIGLIRGPAIYDRDILTLDIAGVFQATVKSLQTAREHFRRYDIKKPNHRHPLALLRARRERPRRRRAAEQRYELAPLHSITSSASASSVGGTVRPSARAVL